MTVRSEGRRMRHREVGRCGKTYGANTMARLPGNERIQTGAILIKRAVLFCRDSGLRPPQLAIETQRPQGPGPGDLEAS